MTVILICTIYFYYIAFVFTDFKVRVNSYKSQIYLFTVANNVGYLKRFAGL